LNQGYFCQCSFNLTGDDCRKSKHQNIHLILKTKFNFENFLSNPSRL
jgi:hypothetical protein